MPRRALLLVNPKSRRGRDEGAAAAEALRAAGLVLTIPDGSDCTRYADLVRAHKQGTDLVIVGGGDGSINFAVPGVLEAGLPLGVLPLGTANNFARNVGVPLDLPKACALLAAGPLRKIDVAFVNDRPFLNVAGLGLSTEINRHVPRDLKKRFGPLAYGVYGLKVARRMRPFHARIVCDGEAHDVRTLQITVCNGRHYGSGLQIAKAARIDDATLDWCSVEVDPWWKGLRFLGALMRGRPDRHDELLWSFGREIVIETRRPMVLDADGEIVGRTPARLRVLPRALTVIAPPDT